MGAFKEAHGGTLMELYLGESAAEREKELAVDYPSWDLTPRQLCDIELLLNGAFSPLSGFLSSKDYKAVLDDMRLASGILWPMPITLDVTREFADTLEQGGLMALRDQEGVLVATMEVEELWEPDRIEEAEKVFGTSIEAHPAVDYLLNRTHPVYVGR